MDEEVLNDIEKFLNERIEYLKKIPITAEQVSFRGYTIYYPTRTPTPGQNLLIEAAKDITSKKIKTYELILNYIQSQKDFSNDC